MRQNTALAKWRRGEPSVGAWLSLGNVHTAELIANAGFDWVVVDLQHGLIDYNDLLRMLPAISTTAWLSRSVPRLPIVNTTSSPC